MKKLFLFLATVLLVGLTAQAMLTEPVTFKGLKQTVNNTSYFSWQIQSVWGQASLSNRQGSSYTFNNVNLSGWNPVNASVNGTLNFQEATTLTDVVTGSTFTVTFTCTTLWFDGATVKTGSGAAVTGCSVTVSSDKHTVTVSIPSGKTFGQIVLDYVPNAPLSSSNTTISGIAAEYIYRGSAIEPVPTVTYNGATLTAGTDYTVSYSGSNSVGTATVTVTGTGNYAGTVTKNYTIRNIALSDFRSLGSNTYEIATTTDLDNLALLVDVAENSCSGAIFKQTADIAYSTTGLGDTGENFTTIGGYFNGSDKNFCGTYDGQGHTISGIRLYKNGTAAPSMNQGLFGRINTGATIKNVILADARITGYRYVGGLVGNKVAGTVQNCLVLNSTITCADKYVGALLGKNTGTLTANYYNNCTVNGTADATNVGVGGNGSVSASSDLSGARSVHALTLPDGVTATSESVTIGGATYYAANTTVTLAYTNAPEHSNITYSVNGNAITGNTFTMPAADATVTATVELFPKYNYDSTTNALTLNWGEFNKNNKWGDEVHNFQVKSVTASNEVSFTGDCSDLFKNFSDCESIDLSNVNTSQMTNCYQMFYGCLSLDSLDLSGFNTSNVTNMYSMFRGCSGLTSLDVSGWNTGNVTTMSSMFYSCSSLTSLDLSDFNTESVTYMNEMFRGCSGLTSLDLSGWNTAKVTSMNYMFYNCKGLTTLNVSGFNTESVIDMNHMFYNCWDLTSLDVSGWNTGNVIDMDNMFAYCSSLTSLNLSGWNTGKVTKMDNMFAYCSGLTSLNLLGWNTGNVTDMSYMFRYCSSLTSLDVSGWNTGNVTNMSYMFMFCSGLTSLDLSGWNTGNVTNMDVMFGVCSGLTTIYAGAEWSTEKVSNSDYVFTGCTRLVGGMSTAYNENYVGADYARFDKGDDEPGYLTGVFTLTLGEGVSATATATLTHGDVSLYAAGTTVTLAYNDEIPEGCRLFYSVNGAPIEGNTFEMPFEDVTVTAVLESLPRYTFDSETGALTLIWGEFNWDHNWGSEVTNTAVKSVTATSDVSFTGDCSSLFYHFTNCESIDLSKVNTSGMTSTNRMFQGCSSLTSLDVSTWDTGNVTDMSYLFIGCSGLDSLDLSGWNTGNVTNMTSMFNGCSGLTSLNVSGFNTEGVTKMYKMFNACSGLTSLDLSGWNTAKVTDMGDMFDGCSGLTSLNLSGWNTGNVTDMSDMFDGCSVLTSLDVSGWNTEGVKNMKNMFHNCSSLTSLNVSGWNTGNVTNMYNMFYCCSGLTSLDVSGWNTGNVTDMREMFYGCSGLTTIYAGEGWSTESVTQSGHMFYGCTKLEGGMGTTYNLSHTDKTYAHIDGGPVNPGYFTAKVTVLRGDVNGDNQVGIADVTALINYLLTDDATGINLDAADCNLDETINISDVTALINYLLTDNW